MRYVVEAVQPLIGRHHGRQAMVIAIVEDLVQLLLRPWGAVVRAQIVQDEQARVRGSRRAARRSRFRCSARTPRSQVVEQVGHHDEQRRVAEVDIEVGDGSREVRLARAIAAVQHQPALRLLRVAQAEVVRGRAQLSPCHCGQARAIRQECIERHPLQRREVAYIAETGHPLARQPRRCSGMAPAG